MRRGRKTVIIALAIVTIAAVSFLAAREFVFTQEYPAMGGAGGACLVITSH